MEEITEQELEDLSDEEREALQDDETEVTSRFTVEDIEDDDEDSEPEDDDEESEREPQGLVRYLAPPVDRYDEQIAAIESRLAEAVARFKAAEIEFEELFAEQAAVDGERRKLDTAKLKHDISTESEQQATEQGWQREIDRFFATVKRTDGVDYRENRSLNAALDQAVKDLGNAKDDGGSYVHANKPGHWFLEEAHKQVMTAMGRAKRRHETDSDDSAGSDDREDDGHARGSSGDFAKLDGLSGLDLEDELARLTPEEAERWLRA